MHETTFSCINIGLQIYLFNLLIFYLLTTATVHLGTAMVHRPQVNFLTISCFWQHSWPLIVWLIILTFTAALWLNRKTEIFYGLGNKTSAWQLTAADLGSIGTNHWYRPTLGLQLELLTGRCDVTAYLTSQCHDVDVLILLELRRMEVMTTRAVRRAKLQSNRHHQQTNTQFFTDRMPFLSPNQQCHSTEIA